MILAAYTLAALVVLLIAGFFALARLGADWGCPFCRGAMFRFRSKVEARK